MFDTMTTTRTILGVIRAAAPRTNLSAQINLSAQYLSDIMRGKPIGSTRTLVRVADVLGLSDAELGASAREMVAPSPTEAGEP